MATQTHLLFLWFAIFSSNFVISQSATFNSYAYPSGFGCDNGDTLTGNQTPMWNVDLQNDPAAIQTIDINIPSGGYGECCSYANNFSCLVLEILLSPEAGGVNFTLAGASGNTYIQYMNCASTPVIAGTPICISGIGPHYFMFCRTGTTDYSITVQSIPAPSGTGDLITTEGCNIQLAVDGLIESSITWSTISPGPPNQYNNYLSNLSGGQIGISGTVYDQDLSDILITPQSGGPSSITVEVCGEPFINSICPASAPDLWCSQSTVTIYPDLFVNPGPEAIICNGSVSGTSVSAFAIGGTAPYTYTWSGPNGFSQVNTHNNLTDNITAMVAGTYTVVLTDGTGCPSAITTVNVIEYFVDIIANAGPDLTTCGTPIPTVNLIGTVSATGTGIWSGGNGTFSDNTSDLSLAYTPTATEVSAGLVTLTLTPTNTGGCPNSSDQITINLSQFSSVLSSVPTNISCYGMTNGSIDLTANFGTPPYPVSSYSWSNGSTTQDILGLSLGTYTVTVTDVNGCTGNFSTTITQPSQLSASVVSQTNISCFGGSDGSFTVTGVNGTPTYSYALNGGSFQSSGTFSGLSVGSYTVTINDYNGCSISQVVVLTQPTSLSSSLTASIYPGGFNVSGCVPDGSIDLTVGGGTPGYSYLWSNGSINQDVSNLSAGSYAVTITDANGCQTTNTVNLTEPSGLSQTISAYTYPSGTNISCFGMSDGGINLTINGGTPGYTYLWNSGQTTQDISGISAGTYNVTITDANGCQIVSTITLTEPLPLTESITSFTYPSGTNISCFGLSDGSIDLSISGGNPGYSYTWSNSGSMEDLSNVPAGTYNVTVTDINGCSINTAITLIEPPMLTSSLNPSIYAGGYNLSGCVPDGAIDLSIIGGSPGFIQTWSNGEVSEDISNLAAGNYTVIITDINGCQTTNNITLTEPSGLTQSISAFTYPSGTNISCYGFSDGSIDLTISGGTPGYTYLWDSGQTTQDISGVPMGSYSVTITDANGCQITSSITLTEPVSLTQTISAYSYPSGTNISCYGLSDGSIDLSILGGSPGYSYTWSNGSSVEDISGLVAGTYSVTVTDLNGCTITSSITLTEPTLLTSSVTPSVFAGGYNISGCIPDGTIDLTVSGGNSGYTYAWSNGSNTEDLSDLSAGTYSVTVTDINGCQTTSSITLTAPNAMTQSISAFTYPSGTNISCYGFSDGSIDLTISGGTPGYTYLWDSGQTTQDITGVPMGVYFVTITDANGCQITSSIILTEPVVLDQTISAFTYPSGTNISCFGLSDGSIDLSINGGNSGYFYTWSNGSSVEDLSGLVAGIYSVIVSDLNGCQITSNITLIEPPLLTSSLNPSVYAGGYNISGCVPDGTIDLTVLGGNPGYTYDWSTTETSEDLSSLSAGNYDVIVTDVNGCQTTSSITLIAPGTMTQTISAFVYPSGTNISCFGLSDGSVDLTITGGSPGYTYLWDSGQTTEDLSGVPAGTYNVTVSDANGCQVTSTITLIEPIPLTESITAAIYPSGTNISCFSLSDGNIDLTIGGGNPGYTYSWTPTATTEDLTNVPAGTYNVLVTDINGCSITTSITLLEPPLLNSSVVLSVYAGGYNLSGCNPDGEIDLTVTGGSPGYSYFWSNNEITEDLFDLEAGSYSITITDINGCQTNLDTVLTQPPSIVTTTQVTSDYNGEDISCKGASDGSVTVNIFGGSPNFTYMWTNSVGDIVGTTQTINGLQSGTYTINITDQNGCTGANSVTLVDPLALGSTVVVSTNYNGEDISCFGFSDGGINLTVTGGTPGYTYDWTNTSNVTVSSIQDPQGLPSGEYFVEVTDVNGCLLTTNIILTEPEPLFAITDVITDYNGQDVSCFGSSDGAVNVISSGGTPGYTNTWINSNGTTLGTSQDLVNVGQGTYYVQIMDINGCLYNTEVLVNQPPLLTSGINIITNYNGEAVSCVGAEDGRVEVFFEGGTPDYTYQWDTNPIQTTLQASGLGVGTYTVIVTDANGCISTSTVELDANPLPTFNLPTTINGCMGAGVLIDSQAEPGSSCTWTFSDGQVIEDCGPIMVNFSNVECYDMSLTIVNSLGCIDSTSAEDFICIMPNPLAGFYADEYDLSNLYGDTYFWNTSMGAETYIWDFGDGSENITTFNAYHEFTSNDDFNTTSFPVTLYAITEYGCIDTAILYIDLSPDLIFYVPNAFTPDGDMHNNDFRPVFASGYSYDNYTFMIFNRWGELIFETEVIEEGWDGTYNGNKAQDGVYTWKLNVRNSVNDSRVEHVGHVSLLKGGRL